MSDQTYACRICDKHVTVREGESAPVCCGQEMEQEKLPACTTASNPEMVRNYEDDEPCADGTVPEHKKKLE